VLNEHIIDRHAKRFKKYKDSGKPLNTLTRGPNVQPAPRTADGTAELCLSFHLQRYCFERCHRYATHRQLLNTEPKNLDRFLDASGVPAL